MAKRGRKREAKVEAVTPGRLKSFVDRIVAQEEQLAALDAEFRMLAALIERHTGRAWAQTYVISAEGTNQVKIGRAVDVRTRLRDLQIASSAKLRLLRTINFNCEAEMHRKFKHLRLTGEWFTFDPEMLAFTPELAVVQ